MIETVDNLLKYYNQLESFKTPWYPAWEEVNSYVMNNELPIFGNDQKGAQRGRDTINDSSAITFTKQLAARLNAWLTNPTTKWFQFVTDNQKLNEQRDVREWFEDVTDIVLRELENSNFYTEINKLYVDMIAYGTGVMLSELSHEPGQSLYFSTRNIREYFLAQNSQGMIDTLFRNCSMTAKEIVDEFKTDEIPDEIMKSFDKEPLTIYEIIHCVFPRTSRNPAKATPLNKRFASVWIDKKNKKILRKSGYTTFPYLTPRWSKTTGEVYGRGPVLDNMGDIKTLNAMWETLMKVGAKMADPPLMVPDEGFGDINIGPGGIIYYESFTGAKIEPLLIGGNVPITYRMVNDKKDSLADAFYITQLQLLDTGPGEKMTAAEVMARQNEKLITLGPTVGVLQYEVLSDFTDRILDLLESELPEKPDMLLDKKIGLRFTSPLARSQRQHEAQSITSTIQSAVMYVQASGNPEVLDNIDFDKSLKIIAEINGAPLSIFRSDDDVTALRNERAAAIAQQQEFNQTQQAAQTLKDGSKGAVNIDKLGKE